MGAVRQWQGLTTAQVAACNTIGTEIAEAWVAAARSPPDNAVAFLLDHQQLARGTGALLAWMGGLQSGVQWKRQAPFFGDLWMGQVAIQVVTVADHKHPLMVGDGVVDTIMYALVSEQDLPNFCLWGWCKGHELAASGDSTMFAGKRVRSMRKDHRDFRDLRELKHLGLQSIARMRECGKLPT